LDQIFSSTSCSQTPSIYVPLSMSATKFHTHSSNNRTKAFDNQPTNQLH
jgi:hypothetical protein